MLRRLRQTSKFILLISLFVAGCGVQPVVNESADLKKNSYHKVFPYNYESVWRAAQLTLKYPIAVNNMENGVLETEWIRGVDGFLAPGASREPSAGIRYKVSLMMVKGKLDGKQSVRMTITKKMERQKDFFSDVDALVSDGLEEKVLFYRIEREILIEEALKKAAANKN